jgi:hypothetical protein
MQYEFTGHVPWGEQRASSNEPVPNANTLAEPHFAEDRSGVFVMPSVRIRCLLKATVLFAGSWLIIASSCRLACAHKRAATERDLHDQLIGKTVPEVEALLGEPDSVSLSPRDNENSVLVYRYVYQAPGTSHAAPVFIHVGRDGHVAQVRLFGRDI